MKWLPILILVAAAVASVPAEAGAAGTAAKRCGQIAFTPNSDDMASRIRATGVSCRTARRFIRAVDGTAPRRFRGYRCTSRSLDTELPSRRYRCVDGSRRISWVKT